MLYKKENFPKLPQEIIDDIIDNFEKHRPYLVPIEGFEHFKMLPGAHEHVDKEHPLTSKLEHNIGVPAGDAAKMFKDTVCHFSIMPASKVVNDWVSKNLSLGTIHASVQEFKNGEFFIPHVDLLRDVAYNYIIETGGDNVETVFYKPKEEFSHLDVTARTFIPYERIERVDSVVCEKDSWYKLDVTKIHSVENIDNTKRRLALTLSVFTHTY